MDEKNVMQILMPTLSCNIPNNHMEKKRPPKTRERVTGATNVVM
jgi:hypothetical protein